MVRLLVIRSTRRGVLARVQRLVEAPLPGERQKLRRGADVECGSPLEYINAFIYRLYLGHVFWLIRVRWGHHHATSCSLRTDRACVEYRPSFFFVLNITLRGPTRLPGPDWLNTSFGAGWPVAAVYFLPNSSSRLISKSTLLQEEKKLINLKDTTRKKDERRKRTVITRLFV
jgi:hypothetical protein